MGDPLLNSNLLNWVNPVNWHITLFFLGNTPKSLIALLKQLTEESFILNFKGPVYKPLFVKTLGIPQNEINPVN